MASLRKLITIPDNDFEKISNFAQKERISVSELLRKAAKYYIESQEELSLSEYIKENCGYVSKEEQKELNEWIKELKNDPEYNENDGSEITLDQIIQGNL